MKNIVITGNTRGIGRGLTDAFLGRGCSVAVSGRTQEGVDRAVSELAAKYPDGKILGQPCDVTQPEQLQNLWNRARGAFGSIDIWINNAGLSHPQEDFQNHPPERIKALLETNLLGMMYGAVVALRGMLEQGFGSLYNMEGMGSDGRQVKGMGLYGTSKAATGYFTKALVLETRGTPIVVGAISPGMVMTEMITEQLGEWTGDWEQVRRIFNILADRVETVTPWLARRILANSKSGVRIQWLTRRKLMGRFLLAPFRKRDLFTEQAL